VVRFEQKVLSSVNEQLDVDLSFDLLFSGLARIKSFPQSMHRFQVFYFAMPEMGFGFWPLESR